MNRRSGGGGGVGQLSMLAQGRGLLGGGVQVECFANDKRAFTLTGQPILKPSTYGASTVKPYRAHQLTLPTTYVTRRGQMVLFTSPEDMIIGSTCHFHERELTSQSAASQLRTTRNLIDSALSYSSTQEDIIPDSISNVGEDVSMATGVKAGHFTNVYLNSLQKASKPSNQNEDDCLVEDIEGKTDSPTRKDSTATDILLPGDSEVPLASECDSGLGHSITPSPSGRISLHSHTSDTSSVGLLTSGHVIRVPDGREGETPLTSEWSKGVALTTPTSATETKIEGPRPPTGDDDPLSSLRRELGLQETNTDKQATKSSSKKKSSSKPGKKRHHPKSTSADDPSKTNEQRKSKKKNATHHESCSSTKTGKSKRRRTRNKTDTNNQSSQNQNQDPEMEIEHLAESGMQNCVDDSSKNFQLTAVQLALRNGGGAEDSLAIQRSLQAEERRREIERKRAEKRELERKKREEEERQVKLQEELDAALNKDILAESATTPSDDRDVLAAHGVVTVGQKTLRANLEDVRLKHSRLLLSYRAEGIEQQLTEDISSAEEALERARALQESREVRQRVGEEERGRETEQCRRCEEQACKSSEKSEHQNGKTVIFRRKVDNTKSSNPVPPNERQLDTFAGKYMFSYFRFVPPQKPKAVDKNGKRKKRPKGVRPK